MKQNDYLSLSRDGKTVVGCRRDYEGVVVIPDGVTEIAEYAFFGCSALTSIEIPDNVTEIGYRAFFLFDLSSSNMVMPNSVEKIGYEAFSNCIFSNLTFCHI